MNNIMSVYYLLFSLSRVKLVVINFLKNLLYWQLLLQSEGVDSALKIQCYVVKNTFIQTAFSAILPTGKS